MRLHAARRLGRTDVDSGPEREARPRSELGTIPRRLSEGALQCLPILPVAALLGLRGGPGDRSSGPRLHAGVRDLGTRFPRARLRRRWHLPVQPRSAGSVQHHRRLSGRPQHHPGQHALKPCAHGYGHPRNRRHYLVADDRHGQQGDPDRLLRQRQSQADRRHAPLEGSG